MQSIVKIYNKNPKVFTVDNFLLDNECEHFIKLSNNRLKDAKVVGEKNTVKTAGRNNRNCWIDHNNDKITKEVLNRISNLVNMPSNHAEKYQIIHYAMNQKYDYHYDGFPIDNSDKSKTFMNYGGQRMVTALVYLNDVEKGGETGFRNLNLTVKPKKGRIVVFENCYKNSNEPHKDSIHSGLPVIKGEKYAFNLWFREIPSTEIYDRNLIRPFNLNLSKLKLGIISTIGKPYSLDTWLSYHFNNLKIDKIVIFYDKGNFPESKCLFNRMRNMYKNLIVLESVVHKNNLDKQKINFNKGLEIFKKLNIDFIFHIDDDELIYPQGDLQKILLKHQDKKSALHFENLEVLKTTETTNIYDFYKNEKYYKVRGKMGYVSYFNGKAGGFIDNIKYNGAHNLLTKDNNKIEELDIKILHYPFMIYEQWINKYNILEDENKLDFDFHKKSGKIIKRFFNNEISEDKLKEKYLKLITDKDSISTLLKDNKINKINIQLI